MRCRPARIAVVTEPLGVSNHATVRGDPPVTLDTMTGMTSPCVTSTTGAVGAESASRSRNRRICSKTSTTLSPPPHRRPGWFRLGDVLLLGSWSSVRPCNGPRCCSCSAGSRTGTSPSAAATVAAVSRARRKSLVNTRMAPLRRRKCAAARACACPVGVSETCTVWPCARPSAFQVVCPWRTRCSVVSSGHSATLMVLSPGSGAGSTPLAGRRPG